MSGLGWFMAVLLVLQAIGLVTSHIPLRHNPPTGGRLVFFVVTRMAIVAGLFIVWQEVR
jgi:hypothetical protein